MNGPRCNVQMMSDNQRQLLSLSPFDDDIVELCEGERCNAMTGSTSLVVHG